VTARTTSIHEQKIHLRRPRKEDGAAIWRLIEDCPPLDTNSIYANLVQCDHFADTCVLAERAGRPVGWVSGHVIPAEPDSLFVWQVAVHRGARGAGLGRRMLSDLLERPACAEVTKLKTTITRDNAASWALFSRFAQARGGDLASTPHYRADAHFGGAHATEHMVTIDFGIPLARVA
jgi:L-2,4-diaminobutyric acid acetyltransferase